MWISCKYDVPFNLEWATYKNNTPRSCLLGGPLREKLAKVPAILLEQCVGQASKLACPKTSKRARQYEETCQDTEWMRKWLAREPISFATQVAIQHCMMKHFPCHYSAALQLWVPRLRAFLSTLKLFTNLQSVFWLEAREAKLKKDTVICKSILVKVRVLSFCL